MLKNFESKISNEICPLCGSTEPVIFYELVGIPTSCNILWKNKSQAINCPKGDIILGFCSACTFITNYALDPEKNQYDSLYDNSLIYSSLFQDFAKKMTLNLIQRFDLHNKTIMEVTVGKVDFLSFFCALGSNKGITFNTSFINSEEEEQKEIISSCNSLTQNNRLAESEEAIIDFVFSYHELEHANSPRRLLNILRESVGEDSNAIFYFSVPNILKSFNEGDFTDIIYEHTSYFTIPSLLFLFTSCGYTVLDIIEEGEGFYTSISIVASLVKQGELLQRIRPKTESHTIEMLALSFAKKSKIIIEKVSNDIKLLLDQGKRIVVWGAGARGVTFLNILRDDRIEYVVDINPKKQGNFIPGTGQNIISPMFLARYKPDYVIIGNSSYFNEIKNLLNELKIKTKYFIF